MRRMTVGALLALVVLGALRPTYAALRECGEINVESRFLTIFDVASSKDDAALARQRLKHVDARSSGQTHSYGLIAFHRAPALLAALDDEPANHNPDAIVEHIATLKENKHATSLPSLLTTGLSAASEHFEAVAIKPGAHTNIALLVVDGAVADEKTADAITKLRNDVKAQVFVISGRDEPPDVDALVALTDGDRRRVFAAPKDITVFFDVLNKEIDACFEERNRDSSSARFSRDTSSAILPSHAIDVDKCASRRIDLMLVLDTSGSLVNNFIRERQLVLDLVSALDDNAFNDGRLQLGVMSFAADQTPVLPLAGSRAKTKVIDAVHAVKFTGRVTRIADAVDAAVEKMGRAQRADAIPVFVLISDGHGQEYWHRAQESGRRLLATGARVYAASTSSDVNAAELSLYTGAGERVFVGPSHKRFVSQLSARLNKCLNYKNNNNNGEHVAAGAASAELESEAFEAKMRTKNLFVDLSDPFQKPLNASFIFDAETITTTEAIDAKPTKFVKNSVIEILPAKKNVTTVNTEPTVATTTSEFTTTLLTSSVAAVVSNSIATQTDSTLTVFTTAATVNKIESTESTITVTTSFDLPANVKNNTSMFDKPTDDDAVVRSFEFIKNDALKESNAIDVTAENVINATAVTVINNTAPASITTKRSKLAETQVFQWPASDVQHEFSLNDNLTHFAIADAEQNATAAEQQLDLPELLSDEEIAEISRRLQNHQNLSRLPDDCLTDVVILIDRSQHDVRFDFGEQLDALAGLVHRVSDADIEARRIRVAAVSFGKTAQLESGLGKLVSKNDLIHQIMEIKPLNAHSSFASAIQLANQEIIKYRRHTARLIVVVVWSGLNGRDNNRELDDALRMLLRFPESEVYALTLNPKNRFERLAALSGGDKWHVFVDARVQQFVTQAGEALITCKLPPSADQRVEKPTTKVKNVSTVAPFIAEAEARLRRVDEHEPLSDVERVEHLQTAAQIFQRVSCPKDELDFILVLDTSSLQTLNVSAVEEASASLRRATLDVLKQSDAADFATRIRIALIRVSVSPGSASGYTAEPAISLRDVISRDDALFAVERLDLKAAQSRSFDDVLANDVRLFRRDGARLSFVVFTDLSLSDETGKALLRRVSHNFKARATDNAASSSTRPAILALSLRNDIFGELSGRDSRFRMFKDRRSGSGYHRFIKETRRKLFNCRTRRIDGTTATSTSAAEDAAQQRNDATLTALRLPNSANNVVLRDDPHFEKSPRTPSLSSRRQVTDMAVEAAPSSIQQPTAVSTGTPLAANTADLSTLSGTRATRSTVHPTVTFDLNADHPRVSFFHAECKVDLVFVIDTSQSVAEEFQRQLQFAVDLVQRLPDEDFAQRVQVAVVSFHKTAIVEFGLGERREKVSVLEALRAIRHTGGSTSTVSGVELAVSAPVTGAHRPDARLMLVLVSDGNSQDEWPRVVAAAERLRQLKADVYAVTVSHDYFFRELELYAGNKWFVYIDARIRQFLDEAEMSVMECRNPSVPTASSTKSSKIPSSNSKDAAADSVLLSTTPSTTAATSPKSSGTLSPCANDLVDVLFILDTSSSVEKEFYAEKNFVLDLIKVLPENDFRNRIHVALVKFNARGQTVFGFSASRARNDILYDVERVEYTGGQTSLASGTATAVDELRSSRRRADAARLIIVIVSDGNSQDEWSNVQAAARRLHKATKTGARGAQSAVFAVTLSPKFYFDELREYTGNAAYIYAEDRTKSFIQDVGKSIISCGGASDTDGLITLTMAPNVEVSQTPALLQASTPKATSKLGEFSRRDNAAASDNAFSNDDLEAAVKTPSGKCKYSKMDLIIILDASTSRENVFEHQRELALSLVERLPISREDTHVAIGINSFTNLPTLRQNLGLGRDRKMVRQAIDDIKYHGGSTLTAKAVELAVQDLERGRRSDAIQVIVLMNDGMSQDPWERVLTASAELAATNAERFGVALGSDVDLRELRHYIGDESRIYRDGSTERFLNDVVSLLNGVEKNCSSQEEVSATSLTDDGFEFQMDACAKPQLDIVVLFDNSDNTPDFTNAKINANRYLLLDVLGSLPLETQVKLSVVEFAGQPKLIHKFSDPQDHDSVFERIESIQPTSGQPAYAKAVHTGLDYFIKNHRSEARGLLLVVGDGIGAIDTANERSAVSNALRKTSDITVHAVDSGKKVNTQMLSSYTGSAKRVYNYDRNSEFAKILFALAMAGTDCGSVVKDEEQSSVASSVDATDVISAVVAEATGGSETRARDIGSSGDAVDAKLFGGAFDNAQKKISIAAEKPFLQTRRPIVTPIAPTVITPPSLESLHIPLAESSTIGLQTINTLASSGAVEWSSRQNLSSTTNAQGNTAHDSLFQHLRTSVSQSSSIGSRFPVNNGSKSDVAVNLKSKSSIVKTLRAAQQPSFLQDGDVIKAEQEDARPFRPGCLIDLIFLIDTSGSVDGAFEREKALAASVLSLLRVGKNNTRVAIIKFASAEKVRTIHSFQSPQNKAHILRALAGIQFNSGVTAIHSALLQAIIEYSPLKGARPGIAKPLLFVVTDGFGQQDFSEEVHLLRRAIPNIYAVAVNDEQIAINRRGLELITGDPSRVFTNANVNELHQHLRAQFRNC